MKCFLITIVFTCFAVVAYSQSMFATPKSSAAYKDNNAPCSKNSVSNQYGTGNPSKNAAGSNVTHKTEGSVISVIPALKLWLLPVNMPNPFIKEED